MTALLTYTCSLYRQAFDSLPLDFPLGATVTITTERDLGSFHFNVKLDTLVKPGPESDAWAERAVDALEDWTDHHPDDSEMIADARRALINKLDDLYCNTFELWGRWRSIIARGLSLVIDRLIVGDVAGAVTAQQLLDDAFGDLYPEGAEHLESWYIDLVFQADQALDALCEEQSKAVAS